MDKLTCTASGSNPKYYTLALERVMIVSEYSDLLTKDTNLEDYLDE